MTKIVLISLAALTLSACSTTRTIVNVYHPRQEPVIVIQHNDITIRNPHSPYQK